MIVIDIGNTNIVVGLYINKKLVKTFRYETKSKKLFSQIKKKFTKKFIKNLKMNNKICIVSSVVPEINNKFFSFLKKIGLKVVNISNLKNLINFDFNIDNKKELGNDRIANTISAINKYGKNCLIVDFGTATTFDVIKNYTYEGGIIAPGINISNIALAQHASKLKKIKIVRTLKVVGKNTVKSMQSGFYWGYVSLVNGIIERIMNEKKYKPSLILTGGLAMTFKSQIKIKSTYDPNLTLDGLYLIGSKKYE